MSVQPPFSVISITTQSKPSVSSNSSDHPPAPHMTFRQSPGGPMSNGSEPPNPRSGLPPHMAVRLPNFETGPSLGIHTSGATLLGPPDIRAFHPGVHPLGMFPGMHGPGPSPFEFKLPDGLPHPLNQAHPLPGYLYDPGMGAMYPYDRFGNPLDLNGTRRKNATRETTAALKAWLYEHRKNPYPTKGEKIMLAIISKMTLTQVSTWFANARRRLKKENKMTWSPRNRTGEDEEDDDLDDAAENTSKEDLDSSAHDHGKESPLLPSEVVGSRSGTSSFAASSVSPRPLACSSPKVTTSDSHGIKRPPTSESEEYVAAKKPKIWSIAETLGKSDSSSENNSSYSCPKTPPQMTNGGRPQPRPSESGLARDSSSSKPHIQSNGEPVMTQAPAYAYLHPWAQMALAAGLRNSGSMAFPGPIPQLQSSMAAAFGVAVHPGTSSSFFGPASSQPNPFLAIPSSASGFPAPRLTPNFASPPSELGPSPASTRTPSQPMCGPADGTPLSSSEAAVTEETEKSEKGSPAALSTS